jgi:eukaryotic-like serine/threonine-protein kinase
MGECWLRLGQVREAAGDRKGAIAEWRRALAYYETISRPQGDIVVYEAGCHALLARAADMSGSGISAPEGHSEAEKAMAILRRLIAGGYLAPHLRSESSLEPLHARDDFRLLLMDVAFPAEPFARGD